MATTAAKPLITVLGASGLLGTAVARELAVRPVRLRLVGRRPTSVPSGSHADVEVRIADLTRDDALASAVDGADAVIHLVAHMGNASTWRAAAVDPAAERVNLGLVHDLVDAIRTRRPARPPVVLFAGSVSQGGRSSSARFDGSEPDEPLTAYDQHKLDAERAIRAADAEGLIRGSTLRLATLYSRGTDPIALDRGVVSVMMRRAFAEQPLTMWNDGVPKRDLLCVDDAATAFVAALDRTDLVSGRHWLIGTGQATSVADLFTMIAKVVATQSGRPPVPVVPVPPAEHSMPTDTMDFVADPSMFQRATGWAPRVSLPDGLEGAAAAIAHEPT
ncbi:NAD-dependent epimerase/dehydratase [Streptosporangium amethystogenes subsp. fukuiense]|uniref:NAD-dependent epimerase/dehydratase n=1 Tax=Streptosporangium amethystogenes subsp. fukuiense TaxID=698418 RepID=A0ABW2T9M2_9ACTN